MNRALEYLLKAKDSHCLTFSQDWFDIQDNCFKVLEAEGSQPQICLDTGSCLLERSFSMWAGTSCELPGPSDKLAWRPEAGSNNATHPTQSVKLKEIHDVSIILWHNHILAFKDGAIIPALSHRIWPLYYSNCHAVEPESKISKADIQIEAAFIAHSDTPHDIFGHFVMDYLPQFAFYEDLFGVIDVVCPEPSQDFQSEFLSLVFRRKPIKLFHPSAVHTIHVKRAFYVEVPQRNQYTFYRASSWALDFFMQLGIDPRVSFPPQCNNDILFIIRPRRRDLVNLDDIISTLERHNRQVTKVALENYNVFEKISLFASHKHLVGVQGSGFAMMPFLNMKASTNCSHGRVSEICPDHWGAPQYAMISNRLDFKHQIFSVNPINLNDDPFSANLTLDSQHFVSNIFEKHNYE
jgi:hypothetical protein